MFAAVIGFWLLCINEELSISVGDIFELGCAFVFAIHIMLVDNFCRKRTDGVLMSCIQFLTAGIISFVFALISEDISFDGILSAWLPLLYSGILSSGVAYTLQIIAQKRTEPTISTLIMSLESVFAALSGWLVLGETLSQKEFGGCMTVLAAVVFAQVNIPLRKKISGRKKVTVEVPE
jgi:drug/metabolite transporter (DMT)-like permease